MIRADNIAQGRLGDCWLLAALAVVADFPGHIQQLFKESEIAESGKYTVYLYDLRDGWEEVEIDDFIPCDPRDGEPLFSRPEGNALWVLLLEKALAKFVGTYSQLEGGGAQWAFQVLTGQLHQAFWQQKDGGRWHLSELALDTWKADAAGHQNWRTEGMRSMQVYRRKVDLDWQKLFVQLAYYTQANFLVSCSIERTGGGAVGEEERRDGLFAGHEYSLLEAVCVHGHPLIELRNPWGGGKEWNGDWSDGSDMWTKHSEVADDLGYEGERGKVVENGQFYMPAKDFCRIFSSISVCPVTLGVPRNSQLNSRRRIQCSPMFFLTFG